MESITYCSHSKTRISKLQYKPCGQVFLILGLWLTMRDGTFITNEKSNT